MSAREMRRETVAVRYPGDGNGRMGRQGGAGRGALLVSRFKGERVGIPLWFGWFEKNDFWKVQPTTGGKVASYL